MRLLRRGCIRFVYHSRHQFLLVFVFLFTLQVLVWRQTTPENEKEEERLNNFHIDFQEGQEPNIDGVAPPTPADPRDSLSLGPYDDWLEARGSNREFFLYSAYLDRRRTNNQVIIVAIVKRRKTVNSCTLHQDNTSKEVKGRVKQIHENWNLPYSAAFILCSVPAGANPTHISLTKYPETVVKVQEMATREHLGRLSVCVKPLHYEYDRALWLVEFIEFYRLLGADKFIFYNHSMGPSIEAVIGHYLKEGVVTLLPWALPVTTQKEIRTEGIFAALNDCNLRSVNRYSFTAMVDFDEFLVPKKHGSLVDLLDSYGDQHSAYVFQNAFFYLYWENDTKAAYDRLREEGVTRSQPPNEPYLLTALKTRRLTTPHKYGVRSKYVVRPERVMELGNHNVWEYVGPKLWKKVPSSDGLSHHYRICEYGGYDCLKQPSQVDRATHTWLAKLYQRVMAQCSIMFPADGFCPPAPPLGSPW